MPILANAKKALRVSKKKAANNRRTKSLMKTFVDKVLKTPTAASLSEAFSQVDKAVKKNVIHRNKAARVKSRLSKILSAAADGTSTAVKTVVKKVATKAKPKAKATKKTK
jgi:ribosomal protein S20